MMKTIKIVLGIVALSIAGPALAQMDVGNILESQINRSQELTIVKVPANPGPNTNVALTLKMYTENLNTANIAWYKNGTLVQKGKGLLDYTFNTGSSGTRNTIRVDVILASGSSFSKNISVDPATVDLLWQSESYTPAFYRGKAMYPRQGNIVVTALPQVYSNGSLANASTLIYKWRVNGKTLEDQSGYGKSVAYVFGPLLGIGVEVQVEVSDGSSILTSNAIVVNPLEPEVVFYENNPLYGVLLNRRLSNPFTLSGDELSLLAVPYNTTIGDNMSFRWRINGQSAPDIRGMSATFRRPEDVSGQSSVAVTMENSSKILQYADGSFNIKY